MSNIPLTAESTSMRRVVAMPRPISKEKNAKWWSQPIAGISEAARALQGLVIALLMTAPSTVLALPCSEPPREQVVPSTHLNRMLNKHGEATSHHAMLALPAARVVDEPDDQSVKIRAISAAHPWLEEMYTFVSKKHYELAIDLLFEKVDHMLIEGQMRECDLLLQGIDLARLESNMLVGLLSVTLEAGDYLPYRRELFSRIEQIFTKTSPERVERLLVGLR